MKQLYCLYGGTLKIKGKRIGFLGREKDIELEFENDGEEYKVFSNAEVEVKNYCRAKAAEWLDIFKQELAKGNKLIKIYNPFSGNTILSDITDIDIDMNYRPATIKECIENMTPMEFNETYGDKLNLNVK